MTGAPLLKIAGVTGWPVHHSLSPVLHNYWLKQCGLKSAYTMFAVHPDEAVRAFKSLPRTTIAGVNVTIPLKQKAYEAADEVSPDAQMLGVCNLLYVQDDKLIGHNTDMEGFTEPLLRRVGQGFVKNNTVLVIGAGGAARAVLGALLNMGAAEIRLINRTDERAQELVAAVNVPSLTAIAWEDRQIAVYGAGLIINASSAGMGGKNALDIKLDYAAPDGWVYDLIYTPRKTPLLKQAKKQGLNIIGGLDMLIAQARPSFHLLYGESAPINSDVKEVVEQHLARQP